MKKTILICDKNVRNEDDVNNNTIDLLPPTKVRLKRDWDNSNRNKSKKESQTLPEVSKRNTISSLPPQKKNNLIFKFICNQNPRQNKLKKQPRKILCSNP
jgi:hypothetical protein